VELTADGTDYVLATADARFRSRSDRVTVGRRFNAGMSITDVGPRRVATR